MICIVRNLFLKTVGKRPVDFMPVGKETDYVKDSRGDYWKKSDWESMRIK